MEQSSHLCEGQWLDAPDTIFTTSDAFSVKPMKMFGSSQGALYGFDNLGINNFYLINAGLRILILSQSAEAKDSKRTGYTIHMHILS